MSTSSLCMEPPSPRKLRPKQICKKKLKEIKPPSLLDKIFHRQNQADTVYYLTKSKSVEPSTARNVLEERSPFKYPSDREQYSYKIIQKAWDTKTQNEEKQIKYYEKKTGRVKQNADLLKRVYVPDKEQLTEPNNMLDLDPEFYSLLGQRKISKRKSVNKYLEGVRAILKIKLLTGFQNDEILLLDEQLQTGKNLVESVRTKYQTYFDSFETFLNKDYEESMNMVKEVEVYTKQIRHKNAEIQRLHAENATLEFTVHKLEEKWRDLKMYQKFLYFVSPLSWRKKFDYIHRNKLTNELNTEPGILFKKYTLDSEGHIPPLEILIDEYLVAIESEQEPQLYFTSPAQLQHIFTFIELQNLNCLLHTEEIVVTLENMRKSMDEAEEKFERESIIIKEMIDKLSEAIHWEEKRSKELKKSTMKLIDEKFKNLVSDDEVLKFHVCLEDIYESCIGSSDPGMNINDMMKVIEQHYNSLVIKLDGIPHQIVNKALNYEISRSRHSKDLYKDTAQKVALVDRLTWRLKKILDPPFEKTRRELRWRSAPPEKPPKPKPAPRSLTEEEKDYLAFFTTYCEYKDDVADFGIDLSKPEVKFKTYLNYDSNK